MSYRLKQWMTENAMGAMFQLNELQRKTGIEYSIHYNVVTFNGKNSQHPLAAELDGKQFVLGTWDEVQPTFQPENALPSNIAVQQYKPKKYTDFDDFSVQVSG